MFAEYPPSLFDSRNDGREIVVEEHHIRRITRDVRALDAHGYSNVRVAQGGSVVHLVAGHHHDLVVLLERPEDQDFVARLRSRKDARLVDRAPETVLVEFVELLRFDGLPFQPYLSADRGRRAAVVSRNHDHADTGPLSRLDSLRGFSPGRVAHRPQRGECQSLLTRRGIGCLLLVRERQHPQCLARQRVGLLQKRVTVLVGQWRCPSAVLTLVQSGSTASGAPFVSSRPPASPGWLTVTDIIRRSDVKGTSLVRW